MNASESDDALAKAFASIASVGERAGRGTLGAYELQVFLKRNFGRSPNLKEMMDAADASEDGARLHTDHTRRRPRAPPPAYAYTYAAVVFYSDLRSPETLESSDPQTDPCGLSRRRD